MIVITEAQTHPPQTIRLPVSGEIRTINRDLTSAAMSRRVGRVLESEVALKPHRPAVRFARRPAKGDTPRVPILDTTE